MTLASIRIVAAACLLVGCGRALDAGSSGGSVSTSTGLDASTATSTQHPTQTTAGTNVETSSGNSGSSSTGKLTGLGFIPGGTGPVLVECEIIEQDCPDGEKCSPWANDGGSYPNAIKCVPVAPDPAAVGERCTVEGNVASGIDSCDAESMCFSVDSQTGEGRCHAFCTGDANAPERPAMSECNITSDGVLTICFPTCDPVDPDACPDDDICMERHDSFWCAPSWAGDAGDYLEPCQSAQACKPGLFCASASSHSACDGEQACCLPFCDLDAPDCPERTVCSPFFGQNAPEGLEHVGFCGG